MTKRAHNFETNSYKKQKLDNDIDALWGDDLDDSILDDCLIRASQVLEEENVELNASILPSYNVFKKPGKIFASTQFGSSNLPSTSRQPTELQNNTAYKYEEEIQKLQQKCEEKDGEVAILRSQLKETKNQSDSQQHKFQNEWRNKFNVTEKQFQSVKSELEFKNLEIANLKQKILEVTKRSMNTSVSIIETSTTRQITEEKPKALDKPSESEKNKLLVTLEPDYPLKNFTETVLEVITNEKYVIENTLAHSARNSIPYLKNQKVSTNTFIEKNRVDMDVLFPIILQLSKLNKNELNYRDNLMSINKLVCAGLQLLSDLNELLEEIKNNLRTEDIMEADSLYLKTDLSSSFNERPKDELGLKSGYIINFLAELLPHLEYFKTYIFEDKPLTLEEDPFLKNLPYISSKKTHGGHTFLKKIIGVLKIIGEIRKAEVMSMFLRASTKVFTNICKLKKYECVSAILCDFTKELIFLRPPNSIICELTFLFKEASQYSSFIEFILNKSKSCSSTEKGIVYFTDGACRFYIFVLMFERYMSKLKTVPLNVCLNLLCFIYNTYKNAFFIHHQNIKECDCLPALYKLEIEIVFRALEKYIEESKQKQETSQWSNFFKNRITIKVLNLMTFHSYEVTEEHITALSQYKEIEKHLQEFDLWSLKQMNINEAIPEIDSKSFENIGFE